MDVTAWSFASSAAPVEVDMSKRRWVERSERVSHGAGSWVAIGVDSELLPMGVAADPRCAFAGRGGAS